MATKTIPELLEMIQFAIQRGGSASLRVGPKTNPYTLNTIEHAAWEHGFQSRVAFTSPEDWLLEWKKANPPKYYNACKSTSISGKMCDLPVNHEGDHVHTDRAGNGSRWTTSEQRTDPPKYGEMGPWPCMNARYYPCPSVAKTGELCDMPLGHGGPHQHRFPSGSGFIGIRTWTTEQQSVDSGRDRSVLLHPWSQRPDGSRVYDPGSFDPRNPETYPSVIGARERAWYGTHIHRFHDYDRSG